MLSTQRFQGLTLKKNGAGVPLFPRILGLIEKTYRLAVDAEREAKDRSLVAYARNQMVEAVGEIATDAEFLRANPLGGGVMARVSSWLDVRAGMEELAVAACMIYGNVGRSDDVCIELVRDGLHKPLLRVVDDTAVAFEQSVRLARERKEEEKVGVSVEEAAAEKLLTGAMSVGIIHAAVGVLKNLAIPAENKQRLVADGVFRAVERMLRMEGVGVGQVWYSAVSLGRLVVVNTSTWLQALLRLSADRVRSRKRADPRRTLWVGRIALGRLPQVLR